MFVRIFILLLLLPSPAFPCSYIGDGPDVKDLIRKFNLHFDNSDEVLEVRVAGVEEHSNEFDILRTFKSQKGLEGQFTYQEGTSCDMYFDEVGKVYIIFGSWINERLHIFEGDGMRSENPSYSKLLKRLGA